jgi:hypothetical protein
LSSSDLVRWCGLVAMLAGLVAFVVDILLFRRASVAEWSPSPAISTLLYVVSVGAGLVGLHALQKVHYGRIGRGSLWTVALGTLALVVGVVVLLFGRLEWLVFPVGISAVLIGFVLYGAATLQARVLPRWYGIAIMVAPSLYLFLGDYAGILFGLVWVALGYALWSRSGAATEQPSRVR